MNYLLHYCARSGGTYSGMETYVSGVLMVESLPRNEDEYDDIRRQIMLKHAMGGRPVLLSLTVLSISGKASAG